jgi:hypothetical protein
MGIRLVHTNLDDALSGSSYNKGLIHGTKRARIALAEIFGRGYNTCTLFP